MRYRITFVLSVFVFSFASTVSARAERTFSDRTYTIDLGGRNVFDISNTGTACVGGTVAVQNNTDGTIHVTLTDPNGTILIDEDVAAGASSSQATFKQAGAAELCVTKAGRVGEQCVPDDVGAECPIVPTVSEWGLIVVTLSAMTLGTIMLARRRKPAAA